MSLIMFVIVVLVIVALLIWAIQLFPLIQPPINQLLMVLVVLGGVALIAQKAGLF